MFLVLKVLVFYIWCCDGMRLGVQVMSACLVDVSVASNFNTRNITLPEDGPEGPKHVGITRNFKQSDMF